MRILFYAPTFLPTVGGAEIMLHNLAQTLTRRGHGVTVLAPKVRGKDNLVEASYRIVRYQRPSSKRFFVRQTLFHIAREKLTRGFDLLHCHGAYPAGFVGASFKTIFRTPLVVRPHGSDILPGEHIRENPRLEKRLVRALLRADAVIAQSDELRELILALGVPAERVVQIPNGVDLSLYGGAPATPPTQGPYVLALGSLTRKKGFDVLIQAMAEVSRQDGAVRLLIAGGGTEKDGLRGLITELGLEDRVTLTGVLSGQAKLDAVKGCIFGVSSSRREPFSNSNLEFMAAGKPLVATRVGGNIEVVKDGVNGILVDREDAGSLAAAMLRLLEDKDLRERMAGQSRAGAQRYGWEGVADSYEKIYLTLAGDGRV